MHMKLTSYYGYIFVIISILYSKIQEFYCSSIYVKNN